MGILRATKYKTFLKLSAAVFLLASVMTATLFPFNASADAPNSSKPIVSWADAAHKNAVDNGGNVYWSVGYACATSGNLIDMPTQTINQIVGVRTNATMNVILTTDGATSGPTGPSTGGNTFSRPACTTVAVGRGSRSVTVPASYVWVSSGTPQYVLIASSKTHDTQSCPVDNKNCTATISQLNSSDGSLGSALFSKFTMIVDITKASIVANDQGLSGSYGSGDPSCESNGFSLSWIMCPVVNGLASAADGIYTNVVQPLLVTPPLSNNNSHSDKIYKAWSSFRTYGDIFLVVALLVTVFGQTIGGGFIDAYTAKKIIPRVLLAAILINLSYYFVGFMMDVTNVIGLGLVSLITAPFGLSGDLGITLNGGTSTVLGIGSLVGVGLAIANFGALFGLLWTFVLVPTLFAFLATAVTLLFRKGLLIFLVLISPIAFALYVLPNTEKYFKQWWNLLFKTLMVFPIIAALFGISKVLAYALDWVDTGGLSSTISQIMSVVALIIPLFLIPFAFKIAGGVIGQVANLATTATKNAQKLGYFKSGRERAQLKAKDLSLQRKQNAYVNLQRSASNKNNTFLKRKGAGLLAKSISGYNIEAEMSSERSRIGKEMGDQIGAGVDQQIRGVTVNKTLATIENGLKRIDKDGTIQYKSLGGGWVNEADVDAGHARWGKSTFAQQFALSYEMSKATTEEQVQGLATNYKAVATGPGGWGNTDNQAAGSWVGATFQNQNQHLALKHTDWKTGSFVDSNGKSKSEGFVDEIYEKKGSYPLAQMSSFTIEKLKQAYAASSNDDEKKKIAAIAETFMHEMSSGGQIGVAGEGDNQTRVEIPGTPGRRQAGSAGSAHVAERVRELAEMAGVYDVGPSGYYPVEHDKNTPPPVSGPPTASGTTLTSNSREQK